jgi:hypothetical protein
MRGELGRVYLAKGSYEDALVEMRRVMHMTAEALGTSSLLRDMSIITLYYVICVFSFCYKHKCHQDRARRDLACVACACNRCLLRRSVLLYTCAGEGHPLTADSSVC